MLHHMPLQLCDFCVAFSIVRTESFHVPCAKLELSNIHLAAFKPVKTMGSSPLLPLLLSPIAFAPASSMHLSNTLPNCSSLFLFVAAFQLVPHFLLVS